MIEQLVIIGIFASLTLVYKLLLGYAEYFIITGILVIVNAKEINRELYKVANVVGIISSVMWAIIGDEQIVNTVFIIYCSLNIIMNIKINDKDIKFCNACNIIILVVTFIMSVIVGAGSGSGLLIEDIELGCHALITVLTIATMVLEIGTRVNKISNIIIIGTALVVVSIVDKSVIYTLISMITLILAICTCIKNRKFSFFERENG